jgi:hypothetical protein
MLFTIAILTWTLSTVGPAVAGDAPFTRRLAVVATAISDDRLDIISTEDVAIQSDAAINAFGQIALPVNEHFKDVEFIEATTIKAGGRHLVVPDDKILVSGLPNSMQLSIFQADVKIHTIVFPDVAVGDTVHYKVRIREKRRGIAGGFSVMRVVPPSDRFEAMSITLDAPKALAIRESFAGFTRTAEESGQRRLISWTLDPQAYRANEPGATAPIDRDPYLVFSSYPDWQAIGRQFLQDAAPMSKLTPELSALAEDITNGITDRRDQARAIHDWVSTNVRYLAIFLDQSGFVPHSAASVLANRYGDCKDHATLMRALLAAKSIDSDYVLIPLVPVYRDYSVPTPDWFNHAILWLPEFDQYVDPSARSASFASLPDSEADKGVLRIGSKEVILGRTRPLSAESNRLSVTADVRLGPDGTVRGTSTVAAFGPVSANLRDVMAQVAIKGGEVLAKEFLSKQNWRGTGNIEARGATDHSEPFVVKTSFELSNRFFGREGNRNSIPLGPRLVLPAWAMFNEVLKEKRTQDFVCQAQTYEQIIDLHLPDEQTLTEAPGGVNISSSNASFKAHYDLRGQTLHIERRMVTRVPGQSCSPQVAVDMAPVIEAAAKQFNWRPQFTQP